MNKILSQYIAEYFICIGKEYIDMNCQDILCSFISVIYSLKEITYTQ